MLGGGMTALGRDDLEKALEERSPDHRLYVTPLLSRQQIGRGAIDLRLGTEFLLLRRIKHPGLDPSKFDQEALEENQERVVVPFGGELWLHPRHFVLAATLEYLGLPEHLSASVVGRSSWGRLGLIVATAVFVHPGFRGCLTLELVNEGDAPICLSPGARVAQLEVQRLETPAPASPEEDRKYVAPVRPEVSRLPKEQQELQRLKALDSKLRSRLGGEDLRMGDPGFEPGTSSLSETRSNQLS
jgi:dCTP deaminase